MTFTPNGPKLPSAKKVDGLVHPVLLTLTHLVSMLRTGTPMVEHQTYPLPLRLPSLNEYRLMSLTNQDALPGEGLHDL